MKFCRFCGAKLPARKIKFCPKCGKNLAMQNEVKAARTSRTRPPRESREKYIQPQPITKRRPTHRPQIQTRAQQVRHVKPKKSGNQVIELNKNQQLIILNQRIKASMERLNDANKNLDHRKNYQLADHTNLILQLNELVDYQKDPLFKKSELVDNCNEVIEEANVVLIRISEFLTSHLQTHGLRKMREQWYELKENQSHLELERDRLTSLNKISEKLEKIFNILSYRLDDVKSVKMERSIFFGAYPQVYHYYCTVLKKLIPEYTEQIKVSGFDQYYKNEIRMLHLINEYFSAQRYHIINPQEVYQSCIEYLNQRNRTGKKLDTKLIELQRQIITNQDLFQGLRKRYIEIMEEVIDKTPHDILLMKNDDIDVSELSEVLEIQPKIGAEYN
ncbi:MAG: hypothetical protein ACC656_02710, partial [Candidatus Heimdallarchaeota archaeon]